MLFCRRRMILDVANGKGESWSGARLRVTVTVIALLVVLAMDCAAREPCKALPTARRSCGKATARIRSIHMPHVFPGELLVRGGGVASDGSDRESDEDEYYSDAMEEIEADATSAMSAVNSATKKVLKVLAKGTIVASKAVGRAMKAAFQGDDAGDEGEDDEAPSMVTQAIRTAKRMWIAAFNPLETNHEPSDHLAATVKEKSKTTKESTEVCEQVDVSIADFGSFLKQSYGVSVERGDGPTTVMGGTIGDALRNARSKARLLVVFIPSARPSRGKKNTPDHETIRSLLSPDVSEIAEKRARKKEDFGSFTIWSAKASSPEAITAIKRLKAKQLTSKGDKRPVLAVAYPAQVLDSAGNPKLVPRLLAQHHCSPPPSPELMAAWLNALRKRHAKQYASMHHELREAKLYKERKEGYKSSVTSDVQRQERERIEEEERIAKENAEKERTEMLEKRRETLRTSLPDEPSKDVVGVMTIALRFPDGRSGQRRFLPDTPMSVVFNWVDSGFEMEREQVVLSTMNGQQSFIWEEIDDLSLAQSGLGRMAGLRVTIKKTETE